MQILLSVQRQYFRKCQLSSFFYELIPFLKFTTNFWSLETSKLAALKSPEHFLLRDMNLPKRLDQPRSWNAPFNVVLDAMLFLNFESEASSENASWKREEANSDDGKNAGNEFSHSGCRNFVAITDCWKCWNAPPKSIAESAKRIGPVLKKQIWKQQR